MKNKESKSNAKAIQYGIIISVLIVILVPIVIWGLYSVKNGIQVPWEASNMLEYCAGVFSFLGTIVLGVVTLHLSKKANETNDRLLSIERERQLPVLKITGMIGELGQRYPDSFARLHEVEIMPNNKKENNHNYNPYWQIYIPDPDTVNKDNANKNLLRKVK
jgi:heme/copper-type cytochrome/quinol oxidase subunit 2